MLNHLWICSLLEAGERWIKSQGRKVYKRELAWGEKKLRTRVTLHVVPTKSIRSKRAKPRSHAQARETNCKIIIKILYTLRARIICKLNFLF